MNARKGGGMRIAMIGQKGLPATYGGIERHVEEIGSRLAARGHDVIVYCRDGYCPSTMTSYRGMSLRHLPTVPSKHCDAIVHSALATVNAMRVQPDIVHFHALGPGVLAGLPRLAGKAKVVLTVHGRDDQRAKWGAGARGLLRVAAWMSERVPDATIAVSRALADAYADRAGHRAAYIPNGVPQHITPIDGMPDGLPPGNGVLERLGLRPGHYVLWVGRMVPEKAPDMLVRAFRRLDAPGLRLALVGGSSFTDGFVRAIGGLAHDDARICLAGYQYGADLDDLYRHALAFALPSLLEGLPLTLLEAVAAGLPVVTSDIAPHTEVVGRSSAPGRRLFAAGDEDGLLDALRHVVDDPDGEREAAQALREDVLQRYSWDAAADATESLYAELLGAARSPVRERAAVGP